MSRNKAYENVSLEEYKKSMKDIYSTCISEKTLDESPFAYKDSQLIQEAIKETIKIVDILKPILSIKAR